MLSLYTLQLCRVLHSRQSFFSGPPSSSEDHLRHLWMKFVHRLFSKAIQSHDHHTGMDVCVKIIKKNKDFLDQRLDEIKLVNFVNKHDPADRYHIRRLYGYSYYRVLHSQQSIFSGPHSSLIFPYDFMNICRAFSSCTSSRPIISSYTEGSSFIPSSVELDVLDRCIGYCRPFIYYPFGYARGSDGERYLAGPCVGVRLIDFLRVPQHQRNLFFHPTSKIHHQYMSFMFMDLIKSLVYALHSLWLDGIPINVRIDDLFLEGKSIKFASQVLTRKTCFGFADPVVGCAMDIVIHILCLCKRPIYQEVLHLKDLAKQGIWWTDVEHIFSHPLFLSCSERITLFSRLADYASWQPNQSREKPIMFYGILAFVKRKRATLGTVRHRLEQFQGALDFEVNLLWSEPLMKLCRYSLGRCGLYKVDEPTFLQFHVFVHNMCQHWNDPNNETATLVYWGGSLQAFVHDMELQYKVACAAFDLMRLAKIDIYF